MIPTEVRACETEWPRCIFRDGEMQGQLARILEATPDFVAICTLDGELTYLNRSGRAIVGIPPEDLLDGRNLQEAHPEWAYQIVQQEGIPDAIREGVWRGETALETADGKEIPVSQLILSHLGPGGEVEFISIIARDISERKRQELAHIEWANRYDAAIRASGQLLFDWDSLTNDVTWGTNTQQLLGVPRSELAGGLDRLREMIHPEDLSAFDEEIARVLLNRDPFSAEFRVLRSGNEYIYLQAKGYFFLDREGRLSRMIGFLADVTARREARRALAEAHDQLEARVQQRTAELEQAYAVIKDRARQQEAVAYLGQRALAGANARELMDEAVSVLRAVLRLDFCAVLEFAPHADAFKVIATTGCPSGVHLDRIPGGRRSQSGYTLMVREPVIVEDMDAETRFDVCEPLKSMGIRSGVTVEIAAGTQPMGTLGAFSKQPRKFSRDDVSFLRSIANVLTAAVARQRAEESIRLAREAAEQANQAKSEFLSRMSHELRTPLNAIIGFTQLLELDGPAPNQIESIEHIARAGQHLLLLINEVLDIARIEAGRLDLTPEPIDTANLLRGSLELIRPLAARHGIALKLDAAPAGAAHVLADHQRLKQVMLNLLSNAVKYNRDGGSVTVRCAPVADGRVRIEVADTGCGIAPEKLPRLFVPFERLGAETTHIEGTGIGLALSRGIVQALGGEIGVASGVGVGSTFWIELPTAQEPAPGLGAEMPAAFALPPDDAPRTLLYIEDQDLNLRLVERILCQYPHYQLHTAMQGEQGLELARERQPDLILLDLNLPDISGDTVLARLKSDPRTRTIPVVMISADAMGERVQSLLAAGAAAYLTKPYRVSEFLRVIREALPQ
jgi:PAS domain S-box-containing protein